jgi:hypothetical protein
VVVGEIMAALRRLWLLHIKKANADISQRAAVINDLQYRRAGVCLLTAGVSALAAVVLSLIWIPTTLDAASRAAQEAGNPDVPALILSVMFAVFAASGLAYLISAALLLPAAVMAYQRQPGTAPKVAYPSSAWLDAVCAFDGDGSLRACW